MGTNSTVQCLNTLQLLNYNIGLRSRLLTAQGAVVEKCNILLGLITLHHKTCLLLKCVT